MRFLILILMSTLLLSGCGAAHYRYQPQTNPQQWQGKNVADLFKQWGQPDQVMHTRTGTSYYLYSANSTSNFFTSTTTNFGLYGSGLATPNYENTMTLQCSTLFKTNPQNIIISIKHRGSNCGGQWVAKSPH